jgi:hypothetical protein
MVLVIHMIVTTFVHFLFVSDYFIFKLVEYK